MSQETPNLHSESALDTDSTPGESGYSWNVGKWGNRGLFFLMVCAGYQFVHMHLLQAGSYLVITDYMNGIERLPYQRRVLPMLLAKLLLHIHLPPPPPFGVPSIFGFPTLTWFFFLDLIGFAVASYYAVRLYQKASPTGRFASLVYPILLSTAIWTYLVNTRAYYYPYDMMSMAFLAAGTCFIYERRFVPLLLIVAVGSLNRETTMFLVLLFVLDALAPLPTSLDPRRIFWGRVPWVKATLVAIVWVGVKVILGRFYRHNDASESFLRLRWNMQFVYPKYWPQLLSPGGYLLPILFFLRRRIPNPRIAAYVLIFPAWFLVMWCWGALAEIRIYGELSPLVAVVATLLLERYAVEVQSEALADRHNAAIH